MTEFIKGIELAKRFYWSEVHPLLEAIPHAAGRLDTSSEVLGLDTLMSTDHDWSPRRLQVFVEEGADVALGLPDSLIEVLTPQKFFLDYLGCDLAAPLKAADWLSLPEQKLLTVSFGPLFHDSLGLEALRGRFAYYPHDVWLYQLASVWTRIGQEEHLVARAGFVGDELGAKVIAARLVRDMMRLGFLMERRYAPYAKWFGTVFRTLSCAKELHPLLEGVLRSESWEQRDEWLSRAYACVARMYNRLGITDFLPEEPAPFYTRPFRVIHLHADFAGKIVSLIQDPSLRRIASNRLIGGIDVFSDSTDLVSHTHWRPLVKQFYE